MDTNFSLLVCRSVRRKPPGEQWSPRETGEARDTKWNFGVVMDVGVPPPLESPRQEAIPTVPPLAPPPRHDSQEFEIRGQDVHAKALRIIAISSEFGRTPRYPTCETSGPGKYPILNAQPFERCLGREPPKRTATRMENVETNLVKTHDRWTQVQVQRLQIRNDSNLPP